ncbi:DUF6783 domain-containing protein, partial [Oliverpabstia intestinalis]
MHFLRKSQPRLHTHSFFLSFPSYPDFHLHVFRCHVLRHGPSTARACLKKAFRELRVPVCGRFYPNEGGVAGY